MGLDSKYGLLSFCPDVLFSYHLPGGGMGIHPLSYLGSIAVKRHHARGNSYRKTFSWAWLLGSEV